mmetsp:Transcript_17066/g.39844  ORF Transcript_17066/g.39844 Transcript_17066/m.39844 type:complete len:230 (-) Transcript_17066:30-719(-)
MSDYQDFYAVLDVARDASDAEIKKAYRKAALRWHPDKNPEEKDNADRMFKLVAEAYDVLSDPQKRSLYDQGGKAAVERGTHPGGSFHHPGGVNPFDMFEQFFGGKDPFAMFEEMRTGRGSDPFADPFFQGAFSGGGAGTSFSSFSSSSGGGGGMMTSTSTVTKVVNGKRVTETTRTVRGPDGRVETSTSTSEADGGNGGGMLGFGGDPFAGNFFGNAPGNRGGVGRIGF